MSRFNQIPDIDEPVAGTAKCFRGLALSETVDHQSILPQALRQPGEIAVRTDKAEAVQLVENLNETIQLSTQTIQQLNSVSALPQLKDYIESSGKSKEVAYMYDVPFHEDGDESSESKSTTNM